MQCPVQATGGQCSLFKYTEKAMQVEINLVQHYITHSYRSTRQAFRVVRYFIY